MKSTSFGANCKKDVNLANDCIIVIYNIAFCFKFAAYFWKSG